VRLREADEGGVVLVVDRDVVRAAPQQLRHLVTRGLVPGAVAVQRALEAQLAVGDLDERLLVRAAVTLTLSLSLSLSLSLILTLTLTPTCSYVLRVTSRKTLTVLVWPIRWQRAIACTSFCGFQSES